MTELSLTDFSPESRKNELINSFCKWEQIDISIVYRSDFKSAKILREIVDEVSKWYWISEKWRTRLVLITDELNNNAIEYGSREGDRNYMTLNLSKHDNGGIVIEVSVVDTWRWTHAKDASDMLQLKKENENKDFSNHKSIRWRGLFLIISHLVDELYFKDAKNWGLIVGARKVLLETSQK